MPGGLGVLLASASVSFLYVAATMLAFAAARRIEAPAPVRFIARNSLVIFLVHMPVYFALQPMLVQWGLGYWTRVVAQLLVNLVLLGVLSEVLTMMVKPDRLRARIADAVFGDTRHDPEGGKTLVARARFFGRGTPASRDVA